MHTWKLEIVVKHDSLAMQNVLNGLVEFAMSFLERLGFQVVGAAAIVEEENYGKNS